MTRLKGAAAERLPSESAALVTASAADWTAAHRRQPIRKLRAFRILPEGCGAMCGHRLAARARLSDALDRGHCRVLVATALQVSGLLPAAAEASPRSPSPNLGCNAANRGHPLSAHPACKPLSAQVSPPGRLQYVRKAGSRAAKASSQCGRSEALPTVEWRLESLEQQTDVLTDHHTQTDMANAGAWVIRLI